MKHIQRTFVWLIAVMLIGGTAFSSSAQDAATLAAAKTQLDKEYRKAKSDKDAREILDRMDEKGLVIAAVDYFASALKTAPTDGRLQFAYAESVRRVADPRYELDRLEEARIQAENALSQAPNERERRLTLARVHLAMKNGDAALDALKPFLGDGTQEIDPPFDKGAHYVAAQVYKQKRDSANADFHLSTILERDSKNVDVRLELADILRRDGWYEKSAEQLGIALRHRNRDPQIYYALGKVYAHMNEPDKVIDMYRRAKTHDPDNAQARYDLAHIFLDNDNGRYAILSIRSAMAVDGRYEKHIEALKDVSTLKAVEILITAATETPDNADLFVFLGRLQLKTGNRSAAKTSFQSAKAADPTDALARAELAKLLLEDEPEAAVAELEAVTAQGGETTDPDLLAGLAEIYRRQGNTEAFVQTSEKLLTVAAGDPYKEAELGEGLLELAGAAKQRGDTDEWRAHLRAAETAFNRAVTLQSNNAEWTFRLATVYDALGTLKALRLYQEAAELDPNNGQIEYRWGVFLLNYGLDKGGIVKLYDPEDALVHLKKAVQLDSKLAGAHYALGVTYKRMQDQENAVKSFEKANAMGFMAGEGYLYLGEWYATTKDYANALKMMESALEWFPDDVETLKDFGFLALKQGGASYRPKALVALEKAMAATPDDPEALMNYGFLLHDNGNSQEAVPFLQRAAELDPSDDLIRYNLALALDAARQREDAINAWNDLLKLNPEGRFADTARERIAFLSR